jgi:hypothetical protein
MLGSTGVPGELKMVISNYVKPNDKVTLTFNRQAKALARLRLLCGASCDDRYGEISVSQKN